MLITDIALPAHVFTGFAFAHHHHLIQRFGIGFQTDDDLLPLSLPACDLTGLGAIPHKTHGKRIGACGNIRKREIPMLICRDALFQLLDKIVVPGSGSSPESSITTPVIRPPPVWAETLMLVSISDKKDRVLSASLSYYFVY